MRELTLGVVDIGSNTVHLLVASTNGRHITPILDLSEGLRLGGAMDDGGGLRPEKLEELLNTLRGFQVAAAAVGVSRLHLLATYAIRVAANQSEVCAAIEAATKLRVEVLPPQIEASLSYLGADANCPSVGPQVMVDIGGGSMQVAVGQNGEVWDSVSLPLGALRVSNRFLPTDPPTYLEEALLVSYLAKVVPPALPLAETNVTGVLGVGGSLRRAPALLGMGPGQTITPADIERMLALVRGRPSADIALGYALKQERARLLLPALLAVREVLRGYNYPPFLMSSYGVREGAILYLARNGGGEIIDQPQEIAV